MNKRVQIYQWRSVFEYWNEIDPINAQKFLNYTDKDSLYRDWILETWGINCANVKRNEAEYSFEIIDNSKFALFMLEFSDCI